MLSATTKLISADDHIIEHPDVWLDRLPQRFQEDSPRIVKVDGIDKWKFQDEVVAIESGSTRMLDGTDPGRAVSFDEIRPGCYDPVERLTDMDIDGVWGQLLFPNYARFAGHRFQHAKDPELGFACIRAYNDFLIEEFCAAAPDRLYGMGLIPIWDVDEAVAEAQRVVGEGAKALGFSENPTVLGLPSIHSDHWDRLWATISALGVPICMHIGSSSRLITTSPDAPASVAVSLLGMNSILAAVDWMNAGVLERFPGLRVILSEGGAGWVPYILERCDKVFYDERPTIGRSLWANRRPPSELFRDHFYVCLVAENFALKVVGDDLPIDNVLWEGDYPHGDGLWPENRNWFERAAGHLSVEDVTKIAETNPTRALNL